MYAANFSTLWCKKYYLAIHMYLLSFCIYVLDKNAYKYVRTSRLMVVSCMAKQNRTRDTTVCYIHEQLILIERSPKAYCKNYLMKKQHALLKPLTIIRYIKLVLNK